MCGEAADFGQSMRGQRHHGDDADAHQREERIDEIDGVAELEDGALARAQPQVGQVRRQAVDALHQLRIGGRAGAVDDRDGVGALLRRAAQHLVERDVRPVPLRAIAARELLRPGRASREHRLPLQAAQAAETASAAGSCPGTSGSYDTDSEGTPALPLASQART